MANKPAVTLTQSQMREIAKEMVLLMQSPETLTSQGSSGKEEAEKITEPALKGADSKGLKPKGKEFSSHRAVIKGAIKAIPFEMKKLGKGERFNIAEQNDQDVCQRILQLRYSISSTMRQLEELHVATGQKIGSVPFKLEACFNTPYLKLEPAKSNRIMDIVNRATLVWEKVYGKTGDFEQGFEEAKFFVTNNLTNKS